MVQTKKISYQYPLIFININPNQHIRNLKFRNFAVL
jgi:hypothetical protein